MDQEQYFAALDILVDETSSKNKTDLSAPVAETRKTATTVLNGCLSESHSGISASDKVSQYFGQTEQQKRATQEVISAGIHRIKEIMMGAKKD